MRGKFVTALGRLSLGAALSLGLICGTGRLAHADAADSSVAKGTVGGAMLGAEIVLLTESALRLDRGWMYVVGGLAGAGAGGYLGYRIGDGQNNQPPALMLAGGIALIIPTIMGVLTATQYALPDSYRTDDDDADDTDAGDDALDAAAGAGARLSFPNVGLAQAFSREDLAFASRRRVSELHLMLLRGVF